MIKIILVPLDGSESSAQALYTALVVAGRFNSHIKAVHVSEHHGEPFMFSGLPKAFRKDYVEMSARAVATVADTVKQQFNAFITQGGVKKR